MPLGPHDLRVPFNLTLLSILEPKADGRYLTSESPCYASATSALRLMAHYPGNQEDLSASFNDSSVGQGVDDLFVDLEGSQNHNASTASQNHNTSPPVFYSGPNFSSFSITSATSTSSANQFSNVWLANHIPLLAAALQPLMTPRVLFMHFISYDMFLSLYCHWAIIVDFILDIIITLTFRLPNFEWAMIWDAGQMAQVVVQALHIFFQVYPLSSVEEDGFQWTASFVYWAQDAVIRMRNTIRREFRGLWQLYNFRHDETDYNVGIRDGWLLNGSFMHHWGVAEDFCLYFANRAIMIMTGVVFYTSPQSIARRMYWLMSYFPDLHLIAPQLSWLGSTPENAWFTVAVGAEHLLGEWDNGVHVAHRWSSRVGIRFSEIRNNGLLPGNYRFLENVCRGLAALWAQRIMSDPVPPPPVVETPPDNLDGN